MVHIAHKKWEESDVSQYGLNAQPTTEKVL
jgi:hypothetical protein